MNTCISTQEPRLGIDFGGVLIPMGQHTPHQERQFGRRFLLKPHPNALQRITDLVDVFQGQVWIVSHCSERSEPLILRWLEQHQFFACAGMRREHVHFCRERSQKSPICAELGITHFIDDHMEIMEILRQTVPHLYLFGEQEEQNCAHDWIVPVANWNDAYAAVMKDLSREEN